MNIRDPSEPLSVKQIGVDTLKNQNISLSNKLASLKRELSDLKQKPEIEVKKVSIIENNFNRLKTHWLKYCEQIVSTRKIFKLAMDEESRNIFATRLYEMKSGLTSLSIDEKEDEFNKMMEDLFGNLAQFYADFIEEFVKNSSNAISYLKSEFGIDNETKKPSEVIIQENMQLRSKIEELSQSLFKIQDYDKELANKQLLEEITKVRNKSQGLEDALKEMREKNESLNRRFKLVLKSQFTWNEELEEEIQLGCICGGKVFDNLNIQSIKVSKSIVVSESEAKKEENQALEGGEDQENNFYSAGEKIVNLEAQIRELQEENIKLKTEKVKMKFRMDNSDEKFFESKLFNSLVTQGHELLKYAANLRKRLHETSNIFEEIDKSRVTEIEEILKKTIEEKKKFTDMIKDLGLSYEEEKRKFELLEQDLIKQQDLCMNFNSINNILKESDEKYNNLNKETIILRGQVKELNDRLNIANAQVNDLTERVATLNAQNQTMKGLIPPNTQINIEEKSFRHNKHRDFFNELFAINEKNNLGLKDKLEDLKKYIKSREEKAEKFEASNKKLTEEVEKNKKLVEGFINEVQINGQVSKEFSQKYNQMSEQLKVHSENISNLIKDKTSAKIQNENEHRDLLAKIKADKELIEKLEAHVKATNAKYEAILEEKSAKEEMIILQKQLLEQMKTSREDLLKKIEELKTEIVLNKDTQNKLDGANVSLIKENENLKSNLKQKQEFITQKLQRSKSTTKRMDLNDDDIELLQLENEKYRRLMLCSVCQTKEKAVVLNKCFHTFCKDCIKNTMEVRNRKCPKCNTKFGNEDIKQIWWD